MKRIRIIFIIFTISWFLVKVNNSWPEKVPQLVFKKRWYSVIKHKVKKGEYLYSILRSYGFSNKTIPYLIKYIKKDNSHIKDLNRITPDTVLYLPKINITNYKVKKGDCVVSILRKGGNIPDDLIYNEYLNLFKILNPEIKNINRLIPGRVVKIPFLKIARGKIPKREFKKASLKGSHRVRLNYKFLCLFEAVGFKVVVGKKIILPKKDGSWIDIDTSIVPMIETPWGSKFFVVPKRFFHIYSSMFKSTKFSFCVVNLNDNLIKKMKVLFKQLEELYPENFVYWKKEKSIVIFTDQFTIEVKSDLQFITLVKNQKRYFFFFFQKINTSMNILAYLNKFLSKHNIHMFFLKNKLSKNLVFKNLFIPELTVKDIIHKNIKQLNLTLNLVKDSQYLIKIYIQLPAMYKKEKFEGLIFTESSIDRNLIILLNLNGYECFTLKNE